MVYWGLLAEDFLQFRFDLLSAQTTLQYLAVGGKEDDFGNASDGVEVCGDLLRIDDLWIGNFLFLDGLQRNFGLVPGGNAEDLQPLIFIIVVSGDEVGNLASSRAAPRCPEINEHILAATYIVGEPRCLTFILHSEVLEHIALFRTIKLCVNSFFKLNDDRLPLNGLIALSYKRKHFLSVFLRLMPHRRQH